MFDIQEKEAEKDINEKKEDNETVIIFLISGSLKVQ